MLNITHLRTLAAAIALSLAVGGAALAQEQGPALSPETPVGRLERFLNAVAQDQAANAGRASERAVAALFNDDGLRALSAEYAGLAAERLDDGGFIIGSPDAPFTLVEFADWACPYCQTYHDMAEAFIREAVAAGQMRFEFRVLPTAGGQQTAYAAALAECADSAQPGAFWSAYPFLYALARTEAYRADLADLLGRYLDMDAADLSQCAQTSEQVLTDGALADTVGVNGTPAVLTRDETGALVFISWEGQVYDRGGVPLDVLTAVIEAANAAEPADA